MIGGILKSKPVAALLGFSFLGLSSYLVYILMRSDDDDAGSEDDFSGRNGPMSGSRGSRNVTVFRVPTKSVRALIGRKGATIKALEKQSNATISFRQLAPKNEREGAETKCIIRGSEAARSVAEHLVREFVANEPVFECETIQVPGRMVGPIIGRCGERIDELRKITGTDIMFDDTDVGCAQRKLVIKGSEDQIKLAKSMIEDVIEERRTMDTKLASREPRKSPSSPSTPISKTAQSLSPTNALKITTSVTSRAPSTEKLDEHSKLEVYVSAMNDPYVFWVQIVGPNAARLDALVDEMTTYYSVASNRDNHLLGDGDEPPNLQVADLVAAPFSFDGKWYRAEVLLVEQHLFPGGEGDVAECEKMHDAVQLYFVDYGDTDWVKVVDVYELRTDFLQLQFQAIECQLSGVKPKDEQWSEDALNRFEELAYVARWKALTAQISGYQVREKNRAKREGSPVPFLKLFLHDDTVSKDIGQELIEEGYAEPVADIPNLT